MTNADVIIVGSGVAALQLAVHISKQKNVRLLTKSQLSNSNSYLAQGGIAAAIGPSDHPSKHFDDTLEAGRYHNHPNSVKQIIFEAPKLIREIAQSGHVFDCNSHGQLQLGMEGAHSEHRIVHGGGDATGRKVTDYLIDRLANNISIEEDAFAYELILNHDNNRCIGVKVKHSDESIEHYFASHIVLATGGCGQLFSYTSNASTVTGDGIALAYQAGAEIADMEFIQFHPTLLYINGETKGLISEAVRGEGARLVTDDGTLIMEGIHPYKDLAPRHIVSQTIYTYLKKGKNVFLDITSIKDFKNRFPSITANCEENGLDLSKGKIPVAPGSHFLMGGVKTDLTGRTTLPSLYAIGETACTGLHGANRLASNSLLEGLYQGKKLAEWINELPSEPFFSHDLIEQGQRKSAKINLPEIQQIQESMMDRVGIVRNEIALTTQKKWLEQFSLPKRSELDFLTIKEITRIFMLQTAMLITDSALKRTESRGGHYRSDYPMEDDCNWLGKSLIHQKRRDEEKSHEQTEIALST
ncbi:L-aspartate oxidase [Neobacillus sp. LXY-1]|uniref:L-aspartate oxidase n=1 Tax=Neobacillus sp. LXY-1 TaxID=3379133 RepID=UPI003EDFAB50